MSLQSILEGDTNKGKLFVNEISANIVDSDVLTGAGSIVDDLVLGPSVAGAATTLDTTITEELFQNDVHLVYWSCTVEANTSGTDLDLGVTYDSAGQNVLLGETNIVSINALNESTLVTGFFLLTISVTGAGAGKQVRFGATTSVGTLTISNAKIAFVRKLSV